MKSQIKQVIIKAYKESGKVINDRQINTKINAVLRASCRQGSIAPRLAGIVCDFIGSVFAKTFDGRNFEAGLSPASFAS